MIFADLHTHTDYSDGHSSVEELFERAHKAGVNTLVVTDHDTVFHWERVQAAAAKFGINTLRGVEMSCYDFDVNKRIHVVGLNLNDELTDTAMFCTNALKHRDAYHRKMILDFNKMGYEITYEDAKKFAPYNIIYKMDIFMAIMEKYRDQIDPQAFYMEHFAVGSDITVDREMGYTDIQDGINAIHRDGGVAILAHPNVYDNFPEAEKYIAMGLDGIEISHPSMKEDDTELAHKLAEKYNLILSGGTDYHGGGSFSMGCEIGDFGLDEEATKILMGRL